MNAFIHETYLTESFLAYANILKIYIIKGLLMYFSHQMMDICFYIKSTVKFKFNSINCLVLKCKIIDYVNKQLELLFKFAKPMFTM